MPGSLVNTGGSVSIAQAITPDPAGKLDLFSTASTEQKSAAERVK